MTEKEFKDGMSNLSKLGLDISRNYSQKEKEIIKQNIDNFSNLYDFLYFIKNNFR